MMISDKQVQQVYRLYGSQAKVKMGKIEKGGTGAVDKVNLSTRGQKSSWRAEDQATPDIRQDRVEALRNAIKSGTYHVSG